MVPAATLELALEVSGCASAHVLYKPRLLSDNGPAIAGELADYLAVKKMPHVRGAPFHPQTLGKIGAYNTVISPVNINQPDGTTYSPILNRHQS